jgi:hypothetical protein
MEGAALPPARRGDVEEAATFLAADGEIVCTCSITGSTYAEAWDGRNPSAEAFAESAGDYGSARRSCAKEPSLRLVVRQPLTASRHIPEAWCDPRVDPSGGAAGPVKAVELAAP